VKISIQSLLEEARTATCALAVIDTFRAFTTAAVALANGPPRIIMVGTVDEALALRAAESGTICMGEVRGQVPNAFDLRELGHSRRMDSAIAPAQRSIGPSRKTRTTPGQHTPAHLCYEEGDANAARAFLGSWLTTYPRNGLLYSHLSWHMALGDLEAGDAAAALRLFREAFSPDVHSGLPRGKVNDAVSFSVALRTRRASA
jgi:2-phosphosulpholactate phosphatase